MAKIVLSTHSPLLPTGYGRVARYVADALHRAGHDLLLAGWGYEGGANPMPYRMAAVEMSGPDGGQQTIANILAGESPDIVFTIGDPWMHDRFPEMPEVGRTRWLGYYAIDAMPIPTQWADWISCIDHPFVFSHWAQKLSAKAGFNPTYIPLAVDTLAFRPSDKAKAKAKLGLTGKFVVGCVAKNQTRKNIPALLEAFLQLRYEHPDSVLLLHVPPENPGGYHLGDLIDTYNLRDHVLSAFATFPDGCDDAMMRTLYNAMDVHVVASTAEGFCLPVIEAGACGVPSLVTNYSAVTSLVPDEWQRVPAAHYIVGVRNFQQAMINVEELRIKLVRMYKDERYRLELGEKSLAEAQKYDVNTVSRQIVNAVETIEDRPGDRRGSVRFYKV